jgi:hypothetical protein
MMIIQFTMEVEEAGIALSDMRPVEIPLEMGSRRFAPPSGQGASHGLGVVDAG